VSEFKQADGRLELIWEETGSSSQQGRGGREGGEEEEGGWGEGGERQATREASQSVVDTLLRDRDPRFARSEFVGFMTSLSRGEIEFEGNTVGKGWWW